MGDRAQVRFKEKNAAIWLYGHWAGHHIGDLLLMGLKAAKPRWTDPSYGTRICISALLSGTTHEEPTGWGIATHGMDNGYDILEVEFEKQEVRLLDAAGYFDASDSNAWAASAKVLKTWTFGQFAALESGAIYKRE